jgi:hypothetical protein
MTNKFDELYENIKIGFPISVQNPSREVPYTVGYDMGKELNDEELAFVADIIDDNGRLTNPYHPTNVKVRSYANQLHGMDRAELVKIAGMLGIKHAEVHHNDDIVRGIINHLGEDPKNWKVLSPYIFTEAEKMKDDPCWDDHEMVGKKMKNGKEVPNCVPKNETAEDDSEWVAHKSEDDNFMFALEDGDFPFYEGDDSDLDHEDDKFASQHIISNDEEDLDESDDDEELDERIVKTKKFRKGKMVVLKKTDKKNHKVVDGKEVKMKPQEIRNRMKAAQKRERQGNVSRKRMKSFKKTMKVRQRKFK